MEEEGKNTSEAWGLPISNVDTFSNLTDSQFLVRVLGPKHMGYEVIWAKYSIVRAPKSTTKYETGWRDQSTWDI